MALHMFFRVVFVSTIRLGFQLAAMNNLKECAGSMVHKYVCVCVCVCVTWFKHALELAKVALLTVGGRIAAKK
jgi:hypothetical protein